MDSTKIHVSRAGIILGAYSYDEFMRGGFNPKYSIGFAAQSDETYWWTPMTEKWIKLTDFTPNPVRDLKVYTCAPSDEIISEIVATSKNGKLIGLKELGWVIHCSLSKLDGLSQGLGFWSVASRTWQPIDRAYALRIRSDVSDLVPKGGFEDEMPVVFRGDVPVWSGRPDLLGDSLVSGVVKASDTIVFTTDDNGDLVGDYLRKVGVNEGWRSIPPLRLGGWLEQPATDKQLATIKMHGIIPPAGLTKGQASEWIDKLFASPDAQASWADVVYSRIEAEEGSKIARGYGCAGYRTPSQAYRNEITRVIVEAEEGPVNQGEVDMLTNVRIDFWVHTFEPDSDLAWERILEDSGRTWFEFYAIDEQLWELLRALALKVTPRPTRLDIILALGELDETSVTWDDETPEIFYQVLVSVMRARGG